VITEIKNPIQLARLILDHTTQLLSLRRVPPNLLVGQGATDYAYDNGMPVLPHDALVSLAARERWMRWRRDLQQAEKRERTSDSPQEDEHSFAAEPESDRLQEADLRDSMRREHTRAMEDCVWNEAQPISPPPSDEFGFNGSSPSRTPSTQPEKQKPSSYTTKRSARRYQDGLDSESGVCSDPYGPPGMLSGIHQSATVGGADASSVSDVGDNLVVPYSNGLEASDDEDLGDPQPDHDSSIRATPRWHDGSSGSDESVSTSTSLQLPSLSPTPSPPEVTVEREHPAADPTTAPPVEPDLFTDVDSAHNRPTMPRGSLHSLPARPMSTNDEDTVTDTVGVIAIDSYGNIACGASSGGIGMKHRGRIGPAALVGVGAAVTPTDPEDKNRTCVGVVTSGTGEHMTTTMAAALFAERMYSGTKKVPGHGYISADDYDDVMRSVIEKEFMGEQEFIRLALLY